MAPESSNRIDPRTVRKVVVCRLYGLGNFLLALPLVDACCARFPKAEVVLWIDERCEAIAKAARPDLRTKVLGKGDDARWLAREKPDLVVFAYPTCDPDLVRMAARKARVTVCHDVEANTGYATINLTADPQRHEAQSNLDLLRAVGAKVNLRAPRLATTPAGRAEAKRLLADVQVSGPYVAVHPGCHGDLAIKRWPAGHFALLADLLEHDGRRVVLIGGPDEKTLGAPIVAGAHARVASLIGRTSLEGVVAICRGAEAVVAGDSGLMHLAAAAGAPVAAVFGPTMHAKNPPLTRRHAILREPVACSPCYRPGRPVACRRSWCLEMVTPERVHDAVRALAAKKTYRTRRRPVPFVSVVVPTYNGEKRIGGPIDSLVRQNYPQNRYEVICVDNGSTDGTAGIVQAHPGVRYALYTDRRTSYAARNHGISLAHGEVVAFTDDDCVCSPDWIARGAEWFAHPEIGGVAGKVVCGNDESDVARWVGRRQHLSLHPDLETSDRPAVVTANVFYRRDVFDRLGEFADGMVSGGDHEMAWRMVSRTRYRFRAAENAVVYHYHRSSVRSLFRTFARYGYGHVDLDRRYRLDDKPLTARVADAGREWKKLAQSGIRLAAEGVSPRPAVDLRTVGVAAFCETAGDRPIVLTSVAQVDSDLIGGLKESGARIVTVPVPPAIEYLEAALDALAAEKPRGLYLFGAGRHTRRLAGLSGFAALPVRGVIDDAAKPGQTVAGLPVVTLDGALATGCRSILVSTDLHEPAILERLRPLGADGVRVFGLYNPQAIERLARRATRYAARAKKRAKAVYLPESDLAPELAAAAARAFGATIRVQDETPGRYSDEFLEWLVNVAQRTGRLVGTVRYRHLCP